MFVGADVLVWSALIILAYIGAISVERLAARSMWLMDLTGQLGRLTDRCGLYRLTPLKQVCLGKYRSPMSFITTSWRVERGGVFRMGLEHGVYCPGGRWLLYVILFPLGMLNSAALALITALIFAEDVLKWGRWSIRLAGAALAAFGAVVLLMPKVLPTMLERPRNRTGHADTAP